MKYRNKSFKLLMLTAFNLAVLILLCDFCSIRSYAINLGENGERIAAIQSNLKNRGYYSGEINGTFDFTTRKALNKFKKDKNLKEANDSVIISALGINSESDNGCFSSEVELLAKHLKLNGIIEYKDMLDICRQIVSFSQDCSVFRYVISNVENPDELISAKPNSQQYSAAIHSLR